MIARLVFNEQDHTYTYDGALVPNVTSILDPISELDGIPRSVLEEAAARGTAVHRAVELHLLGDLDESSLHPDVAVRFHQFLRFVRETGFRSEFSEQRVFCEKYKYAGTLDLVGRLARRRAMVDIKATSALPRTAGPQTAAYEHAFRPRVGGREMPRYALQLLPDRYVLHPLEDARDFRVFLACLTVHNWRSQK